LNIWHKLVDFFDRDVKLKHISPFMVVLTVLTVYTIRVQEVNDRRFEREVQQVGTVVDALIELDAVNCDERVEDRGKLLDRLAEEDEQDRNFLIALAGDNPASQERLEEVLRLYDETSGNSTTLSEEVACTSIVPLLQELQRELEVPPEDIIVPITGDK
jgi:hypothetical protein